MTDDDTTKQLPWMLLRYLLTSAGTVLAAHGLIGPHNAVTPDNWQFIMGAILTLAPVAWAWWEKLRNAKTTKEKEAIAVQAGINLVHEGASILIEDGRGNQVPKPVTQETAQAIIKNFGPLPDDGTATRDLNLRSIAVSKGQQP